MQKNNKLNIPAVLMHEVNGVQYRVNGIITAINESNNTCSMKFRGYPVFNGIPMNSIYMNEAFLDKVKEYGKKAWQGIKKLVKAAGGFLFPEGEDGRPDMEYLYSPINIAIASMIVIVFSIILNVLLPMIFRFTNMADVLINNASSVCEEGYEGSSFPSIKTGL